MSRGGVKIYEGRVYARVRYGQNERLEQRLPWATEKDRDGAALERAHLIGELCDALVASGRRDRVKTLAKEIAEATTEKKLQTIRAAVAAMAKMPAAAPTSLTTFKDVADRWISGELRQKYPDHVHAKADFHIERGRLKRYIYPHVKDVPIEMFERAHADLVMSKLPPNRVKAPGTRRHIAQIVAYILTLSVMPLGLIKVTPIPKGWLPRIGARRHYTCLFPREETLVLGNKNVDEALRLFIGILDREGMRVSELADSEWFQWNLQEGVFLATKTKTNDPRMWALRPDVARAMRIWHERYAKTKARPFIDVVPDEKAKLTIAERLRDALKASSITRAELFTTTAHTGKMRVHDLRATFVTVSLAEGKPETWIRDRTAHKTLSMIDRYRRTARQFGELNLGSLVDLVDALGWGISRVILATGTGDDQTSSDENDDGFRRKDSNLDKRIQKPVAVAGSRATPAIVAENDEDDPPSGGGITHGSPTLVRLATDLALERARWAELDLYAALDAAEGDDRA